MILNRLFFLLFVAVSGTSTPTALAYFIDGQGHYGLRPETRTYPGFSKNEGLYQATLQSFRLLADVKANDKLSMKLEFQLFDNPRTAYLGDDSRPQECSNLENDDRPGANRKQNSNSGNASNCEGRHQDTNEPGYRPYTPRVTEAYVKYGFEYCLLEVGRRGRDWGLGAFLDSGHDPFDQSYSIFDGITCNINIQKNQALGFAVGWDRITETGANIDVGIPRAQDEVVYGPTKSKDDIDQMFFIIEYDDRKTNKGASFNRQVGIYFAKTFSQSDKENKDKELKTKTDISFADLYTGLFFRNFAFRNEVLFRLGKSTDPSWSRYGGLSTDTDEGAAVKNNVNAIGVAGDLTLTFGRSGSYVGPEEYFQGNASNHQIFMEYAYAPGDRDGYYSEGSETDVPSRRKNEGSAKKVKAMAFHRNYKPALILFNANPQLDEYRIDGIFDPGRVMNAIVLSTGYRYNSLAYGNFGLKFISATMNKGIPDEIKQHILKEEAEKKKAAEKSGETYTRGRRPVGFHGRHLGYELDLSYSKHIGKNLELGGVGAVAIPGSAWRTEPSDPQISYSMMGNLVFRF